MKIRWNQHSLRLRITPEELEALGRGAIVTEQLRLGAWRMNLQAGLPQSGLASSDAEMHLHLSTADFERFLEPQREGLYFEWDGFKYYVEKDFPCEHPSPPEVAEPSSTFPRPEPREAEHSS
jgi:hypothetical protein